MFEAIINRLRRKAGIPEEKRPPLILDPSLCMPDYIPDPVEDCFCGSGKFFKSCCGSMEARRAPPYGVFVVENYLDALDAAELRDVADRCKGKRLMVIENNSDINNLKLVEDQRRVSDRVELGPYQRRIDEIIEKAFIELAEYYFKKKLDWYERPQLLRYSPGGFYVKHADSENMDPERRTWTKTIDRDLSLLIYLNDDYKGGELFFEKFNYRLRPKAGMAVIFPSDNRYLHEAQTITQGQRYAIVSWASVKGVPKVSSQPPQSAVRVNPN